MNGIRTLNDFPTDGGMLSPRSICSFLIPEIHTKSSVAIRPMITPANIACVPTFPKVKAPDTATLSPPSNGVTLTTFGIITTRAASETIAAAMGLSKPLFLERQ